jgi:hypothetical protein
MTADTNSIMATAACRRRSISDQEFGGWHRLPPHALIERFHPSGGEQHSDVGLA